MWFHLLVVLYSVTLLEVMEKNSLRKWGQAQGTVGGFRLLVTCSSEEVGLGDIYLIDQGIVLKHFRKTWTYAIILDLVLS